jgi:hypothetical protein
VIEARAARPAERRAVTVHRLARGAPHGASLARRGGYRPREIDQGSEDNR